MELFARLVARRGMSSIHSDSNATQADDAELVRRLGEGDSCAAQALYGRHVGALLRFAVAIGGCRQTAEDAVHDTFIELLRHPGRFDPRRGSLGAYLFSIARHRMARSARTARRSVQLQDEPSDSSASAGTECIAARLMTAEDEAERAHTIDQVRTAILALPLLHREIIALCDLEELPYADVALILSCPLGTVRSRLHRARAQLAQQLQTSAPQHAGDPATLRKPIIEAAAAAPLLTCRDSAA
jgi:RNA polymerase sigma-70 factor, ECF subfamily